MNKKDKAALYKCSIKDFLDEFRTADLSKGERFQSVIYYIAKHGMQGSSTDCSLAELLYTAKHALLNETAQIHLVPGNNYSYTALCYDTEAEEEQVRRFIADPINYLEDAFEAIANEEDFEAANDRDEAEFKRRLKANARRLGSELNSEYQNLHDLENRDAALDVITRITSKMSSKAKDVDQALKYSSGNFFQRLFSRTSHERANFKQAFNDFRNKNSVYHGDLDHLEKETKAYLHHKIPEFRIHNDMPTEEQLNRLTGTDKTKVEFCINVLKSIQENRSLKPHMEATFNALTNNFYNDNEEEIDNSQHSFQEELSQEVNKSVDKDISVDEIHNEPAEKVKEEDLSELNDDDQELFGQLVNK